MELGKPTFIPVRDAEMGFEKIVKIAHSLGGKTFSEAHSTVLFLMIFLNYHINCSMQETRCQDKIEVWGLFVKYILLIFPAIFTPILAIIMHVIWLFLLYKEETSRARNGHLPESGHIHPGNWQPWRQCGNLTSWTLLFFCPASSFSIFILENLFSAHLR